MATLMQPESLQGTYVCDQCGLEAPADASLMELERKGWHEAYGASYLCPECRAQPMPFERWTERRRRGRHAANGPAA
jgi:predicted RNA-binding Zn-ribbon protein involved in translation (DUF1610 family)